MGATSQIQPGSHRNLFLATVAFAVAFSVWGLIAGLTPLLKSDLDLSAAEASLMLAVPVLLGALGRLPIGLLTDRLGGRVVFSALLIFAALPPTVLAINHSYGSLLLWGFWLGMAGSSFAAGVAFVSPWFPAASQGMALGIYGAGNIGQSIAVFVGPVLARRFGISTTLLLFAMAALAWGLVFAVAARDSKNRPPPRTLQDNLSVLQAEPLTWMLSLFYFLTFGGFVALGIYLPLFLKEEFSLTAEDAGARAAGFIVLATVCRPLGGVISDRIGGQRMLGYVFVGIALLAWLHIAPSIYLLTIGALGCAALFGLGNGAVFKLVPQYFPTQTGTVTGMVGAAGGLGGFFPPIVLGMLKDLTGGYALGFVLLSLFALGCAWFARRPLMGAPMPS